MSLTLALRKVNHPSASAALDQLILAKKLEEGNKRISANVTNYYDSISAGEKKENWTWGQFGETQFSEE